MILLLLLLRFKRIHSEILKVKINEYVLTTVIINKIDLGHKNGQ